MTLGELHLRYREKMQEPGFPEAFNELLAHHFSIPAHFVWTRPDQKLPAAACRAFFEHMERYEQEEPLAYLTGSCRFNGLEFAVSPAALIPRPDTECLLQQAVSRCPEGGTVLDIGCGSGILGICLALQKPGIRVAASDKSFAAVALAGRNACRHGVDERMEFHVADLFPERLFQPVPCYDLILSNPPYIAESEWETLDAGVRDYEPRDALLGGVDGLDFYRRIIPAARERLCPGGWLLFEVGYTQAGAVREIFEKCGYSDIEGHRDFGGHERVVEGRRRD